MPAFFRYLRWSHGVELLANAGGGVQTPLAALFVEVKCQRVAGDYTQTLEQLSDLFLARRVDLLPLLRDLVDPLCLCLWLNM